MAAFILGLHRSLPVLPKDTVTPFLKGCVLIGGLDQHLHYLREALTPKSGIPLAPIRHSPHPNGAFPSLGDHTHSVMPQLPLLGTEH